jgi:hypothetical protein
MTDRTIRRYTHLPAVIQILTSRELTLLDPSSWEDRNDSHYLALYKKKRALKTLLVLCFTQAAETFHHWKIYAGHPGGACIVFRTDAILAAANQHAGFRFQEVKYRRYAEQREYKEDVAQFPFVKRFAYRGEEEFRIVYESKSANRKKGVLPIDVSSIEKIILSPWLPSQLLKSVSSVIHRIPNCEHVKVIRSTVIASKRWMNLGGLAP